jgi:endonuclease YncB( thermonuclease family)
MRAKNPAADRVDRYGRLLRYVVRVGDGMIRLVAVGAAAPSFFDGQKGRYFSKLQALAKRAKAKRLGLVGHLPADAVRPVSRCSDEALTDE